MKADIAQAQRVSFAVATATRIPVPTGRGGQPRAEAVALRDMQPAPTPVGKQVAQPPREHWSTTFSDLINAHVWRREALDAFESHAFTGAPGTERWCSRCTYMLAPEWKDPKKPVPLSCGDPRIVPRMAAYEYVDGNPVNGIRLADPAYSGAKVKDA